MRVAQQLFSHNNDIHHQLRKPISPLIVIALSTYSHVKPHILGSIQNISDAAIAGTRFTNSESATLDRPRHSHVCSSQTPTDEPTMEVIPAKTKNYVQKHRLTSTAPKSTGNRPLRPAQTNWLLDLQIAKGPMRRGETTLCQLYSTPAGMRLRSVLFREGHTATAK